MAMADHIVMSEMTWTEVDEAMKDRPVGILPVGAIEAHGPHLPVNTDTVIAIEMAKRGAAKLKEHGVSALILPPVSFTVSDFAAKFPGTISVSPETSVALLRDVCVFNAKRFRAVAMANIHFDPGHIECLKTALEEARKAGASVCWADVTKKRWADLLGETFAEGDHAGAFETSLMMAAAPDRVRERERISLAPVDGLMPALKKGAKTFAEAGGEDAYFGDPTAASAEEGDTYFEALAEILSVSIMEHLGSKA
ncbi:MAG TPA: creatininase family protein [Vicinamibacteria bacterium]|nr:creatininase family protein [Vicinamibacteria bacterium]